MNRKWLHSAGAWLWRHNLLSAALLVVAVIIGSLVFEHVRGSIILAHYLRDLRARGEKMTVTEIKPARPEGENGAPEVLAVARKLQSGSVLPNSYPPRMRLTPAGHAIVGFREEEWVDGKVTNHWEQLAVDLQANEATLATIRSAMAQPVLDCDFDPSLGPLARFPHLSISKTLTQWFASSIQLSLHEGKPREAVPDLVTETDLPRMLARDGIVISELVRIAIASIARADAWEVLQADGWTDDDLARIQRVWERQEFLNAMVRALEGERVFAQSTYEMMRKSNQQTADVLFGLQLIGMEDTPKWEQKLNDLPGGDTVTRFLRNEVYSPLWRFAWLDQDLAHYLKYLQEMINLGREASQEKSLKAMEPRMDELMLRFQNRGFYDKLRFPSEMSVSSLSRVLYRVMRVETERSLVLGAIALKRYILRYGKPPSSLSALVPEFLSSVPVDYMDGQPVKYRAQPDGGFLLYSVGEDGKDDGGDASLAPGKISPGVTWNRKDVVWPAPATAEEVEVYRRERK